jgi:uncharacterized protein YbbC (DUF1343 family)
VTHWFVRLLGSWCLVLGCGRTAAVPAPLAGPVRPGIDVLLSDSLYVVRGHRVGLVTNPSGVDSRGVSDVERLRSAGIRLVALFSPEHGFRGTAEPGAAVASSTDSATGLPIYSLYGASSAPTPQMLRGIDLLLVDLQDAGARYYTYLFTTVGVLRAAANAGIPVMVLDRPAPIGGEVQGNVLDPAYASPVGLFAIPMRHGMTLGELSLMAKAEFRIPVRLKVIPAAGWTRRMAWEDTGLPFIPPSPNLRTRESLFHYPGLCLFEGTSLSVGRGTDAPFEQIGAPWLDTAKVLTRLETAQLAGVQFRGVSFTPHHPGDGKFADTTVNGIRLILTDRASYDPTRVAVTIMTILETVHPLEFGWNEARFDRLAGGPSLRLAVISGTPPDSIVAGWLEPLQAFLNRRAPFLIYPDQ